jgi:tetratricopeptide (TPR) repeat protein
MDELFQLKEKTEEKKRNESQLNKALQDYRETKTKLAGLTTQLKKELKDVQQLEDGGIAALFYSVLGNKVEKLDKERQEYLAAKLKYENCKNEQEQLEIEIARLKSKIVELGEADTKYKKRLEKKSALLKINQDNKFVKYEHLIETCLLQKNELNEAIDAGEKALNGLRLAIQSLRKAKNWGIYDMVGGGLLATAIKHSNIDEAKSLILDVQVWLKKFKRELSDVGFVTSNGLSVQLDSFSTFADYFFDNLIFDWVVQDKINRSLEGCESICKQVLQLVTQLRINDVDITQKYNKTKADLTAYIEEASI